MTESSIDLPGDLRWWRDHVKEAMDNDFEAFRLSSNRSGWGTPPRMPRKAKKQLKKQGDYEYVLWTRSLLVTRASVMHMLEVVND